MKTFRKNAKLKVFIQANCQSHALRAIFQRVERLNNKYEIIDVKPVHLWQEEDFTEIVEKIKACDVFLHQPIFKQHFGKFASDNLKRYLKDGAKAISFPNLYFTGYHPQAFYLKDASGKKVSEPFDYHDRNILEFYKQGLNEEEILEKIQDESFYSVREIEANIAESLKSLRDREKHTDIKVSDYIEKNMIGKKLFHIFNHPTNEMIFYLFNSILTLLDESKLDDDEKALFKKEMLGQVEYPVYPSVQKYFEISEALILENYGDSYSMNNLIIKYKLVYNKVFGEELNFTNYINYLIKSNYLKTTKVNSKPKHEDKTFIKELLEMIRVSKPFSLIRLGDGEGNILFWGLHKNEYQDLAQINMRKISNLMFGNRAFKSTDYDYFYNGLKSAIIHSDIIGLPTYMQEAQIFEKILKESYDIDDKRGITGYLSVWDWFNNTPILEKKMIVNSHIHLTINTYIKQILSNNIQVSVITCYPELLDVLVNNFKISKGKTYLIPPQASNIKSTPSDKHYPDIHNKLVKEIENNDFTNSLVLVGAGILGKIYCSKIKQSAGMAIDVGSLMDAWLGKSVRNYHNENYINKSRLNKEI